MYTRWLILIVLLLALPCCKRQASAPLLPFSVKPQTTVITQPRHADGTPDYIEDLNQRFGAEVTPETNGYLLVLAAAGTDVIKPEIRTAFLQRCGARQTVPGEPRWEEFSKYLVSTHRQMSPAERYKVIDECYDAAKELWTNARRPLMAAYLAEREPQLALLAQAMELPHYWVPLVPLDGRSLASATLSGYIGGPLREMVLVTCARAMRRAGEADFDGFLADILTVKRLARKLCAGPMFLNHLTAYSIEKYADEALGIVAGSGKLTAPECRRIRSALAALGDLPSLAPVEDVFERWNSLDTAVLVAMGDRETLEKQKWPEAWEKIDLGMVNWDAVLAGINRRVDALRDESQKLSLPELEAQRKKSSDRAMGVYGPAMGAALRGQEIPRLEGTSAEPRTGESRDAYSQRVCDSLLLVEQVGGFTSAELLYRTALLRTRLLTALLAAAEARATAGHWPARFADLPQAARDAFAPDPYAPAGAALGYSVSPAGARVYSVGPNAADEGGETDGYPRKDDIGLGPQGPPTHKPAREL